MDEDYKCTLSEACLKQAMSELSEDPKNRLSSVQTLREWIETQKHLNYHTGKVCGLRLTTDSKNDGSVSFVYQSHHSTSDVDLVHPRTITKFEWHAYYRYSVAAEVSAHLQVQSAASALNDWGLSGPEDWATFLLQQLGPVWSSSGQTIWERVRMSDYQYILKI